MRVPRLSIATLVAFAAVATLCLRNGNADEPTETLPQGMLPRGELPRGRAPDHALLRGIVVDQANQAVVGATVWLADYSRDKPGQIVPFAETQSGADGRFSFPDLKDDGDWRNPTVIARDAGGRIDWNSVLHGTSTDSAKFCRMRLREVQDLHGRVVDAEKRPIAGALVKPESFLDQISPRRVTRFDDREVSLDRANLFAELAEQYTVRTVADGTFVLPRVPAGTGIDCSLSAAGFAGRGYMFEADASATATLECPAVIAGSLALPAGIDLAAQVVELRIGVKPKPEIPLEYGNYGTIREVTVKADGSFRFDDVPPGRYEIVPMDWRTVPFYAEPTLPLVVKARETIEGISIPLEKALAVRGRVVEVETGLGIENVQVQVIHSSDGQRYGTSQILTTGAKGRFTAYLKPGFVQALVQRAPVDFVEPINTDRPFRQFADGDEWPAIELQRSFRVEGLVVNEAGEPVANAGIHVTPKPLGERRFLPRRTDRAGKFTIEQLDPATTYQLRARTADAVTDGATTITAMGLKGPVKLIVAAKHAFHLRGRVVDHRGRPIVDGEVFGWQQQVIGGAAEAGAPGGRGDVATISTRDAYTVGDDGTFETSALWPGGQYHVTAAAKGHTTATSSIVEGAAGKTHDLGRLVLTRIDLVVAGRVVDDAGLPVADAEVQVVPRSDSSGPLLRSDADGKFSVPSVDASSVLLLRARTATATTDGTEVVLPSRLEQPVTLVVSESFASLLRGKVVGRGGKPPPGVAVSIVWDRRGDVRAPEALRTTRGGRTTRRAGLEPPSAPPAPEQLAVAADGAFETAALWPDEHYHVVATAKEHEAAQSAVVLALAGETRDLGTLELRRCDVVIEGRVVDSAGRPVVGATVRNSGDAPRMLNATTDAEGRFRLAGLYDTKAYLLALDYRAAGWRGTAGDGPVEIKLLDHDERPATVPLAEPPPSAETSPPFTEQRKLARRLLIELRKLNTRIDDPNGNLLHRLTVCMGKIDPLLALRWSAVVGGSSDQWARVAAAEQVGGEDIEGVLSQLAEVNANTAVRELVRMAKRALTASAPGRAAALLEAAMARVRSGGDVFKGADAAATVAQIGALAIAAGREEWGRKLIDEAAAAAEETSEKATVELRHAAVAQALALYDAPRARRLLDLIIGNSSGGRESDMVRAIAALGARDFDLTRELLRIHARRASPDGVWSRIAYELAPTSPEESLLAIGNIASNDPSTKAETLGWCAVASAPSDQRHACSLIDRALDLYLDAPKIAEAVGGQAGQVVRAVRGGRPVAQFQQAVARFQQADAPTGNWDGRPVHAARLALHARAIGYPDLPSVIDRVMAVRLTRSEEPLLARRVETTVMMARILSLVDPAVARELLASVEPHADLARAFWLQARVLADLDHAEQLLNDEFARQSEQAVPAIEGSGLLAAVEVLAVPPDQRAAFILRPNLMFWFPDED